jgi:hypothetical protein
MNMGNKRNYEMGTFGRLGSTESQLRLNTKVDPDQEFESASERAMSGLPVEAQRKCKPPLKTLERGPNGEIDDRRRNI